VDDDRLGLAAKRQLAGGLEREAVVREAAGGLGDQDRTGIRGREQTRRRVHGVSRDGVGITTGAADAAGHHRPGVDAHVQDDGLAETRLPFEAQRGGTLEQLERGLAGTRRIVLVRDRRAEDREHRVADEFLHEAVVALDRPGERLEQYVL